MTSAPPLSASGDLTAAERLILDAVDRRASADTSSLAPEDRRVRAEVLQALLSGDKDDWPVLCCPLNVCGALIEGPVRPPSAGTTSVRNAVLHFTRCVFDAPVDLSGAEFLALRFVDCDMPGFIGASLTTKADLEFSGCRFAGVCDFEAELSDVGKAAIHLNHARIGGHLNLGASPRRRFESTGVVRLDGAKVDGDVFLGGALLNGDGDAAFSARSALVGGNVVMSTAHGHRFEAAGELALVAARVTGDLDLGAASLSNPSGRALHCEDLNVETVFLNARDGVPFEARGRLNFLSAIIGGSFFLTNARLVPGPDYSGLLGTGGPVALNLQQLRVSNALAFAKVFALAPDAGAPPRPVAGWFLLSGAQLGGLIDGGETGWPAPGFLDIDGVSYDRIRNVDGRESVAHRLAWLNRQYAGGEATAATFRPQPYEELARVLRRQGQAREANEIAVEKIRQRLAAKVDPGWARALPQLLMLISRHGYSSGRAALSFGLFVALGSVMYALALWGFGQSFVPIETDPVPTAYVLWFDAVRQVQAEGCPAFALPQYALDVALPVIDLGQASHCRFAPHGPVRWLWSFLHSIYALAGAGLSAVVVLTLTGVLRRD